MSSSEGFATTHWSLVVAAGQRESPHSAAALESLCRDYWYPLYAYLRRRGLSSEDAQDVTQSFFAALLEKDRLKLADQQRGRFRSFLLASLSNFLANYRRDQNTERRGGAVSTLSLDWQSGEQRYHLEPVDSLTPERIFDRRWALTLLERAIERLRVQYVESGRETLFQTLRETLGGADPPRPYADLAAELGISESALRVAVHRLRKRCGEILREEIAQTVVDPAEIDEELSYLFTALA
ncbi:MAG: sigma-70 family RNA polymerase sigma factor [Pirellulales bacterium]